MNKSIFNLVSLGVLSLIIIVTLFNGGCSQNPTTASSSPAASAPASVAKPASSAAPTQSQQNTPQKGGTLTLILCAQQLASIGYPPKMSTINDNIASVAALETLIYLDDKGMPVPKLAESFEFSSDAKSFVLHLRKGVKFHDGTDFNAAAVKYDLENYQQANMVQLANVTSIDAADDYTVRLNLKQMDSSIPISLANFAGIMISPTTLKNNGKDWCVNNPVGTGPFKLVSFQPDVSIKFTRFDNYWQTGKPLLDNINWVIIADSTTAATSFQKGEGQVLVTNRAPEAAALKNMGKYVTVVSPVVASTLVGDSAHSDSPFANLKVRKAVEYAVDWKTITEGTGFGIFKYTNQIAFEGMGCYDPAIIGYPYNPTLAKQLLTEAGYPNGFKTRLIFTTPSPANEAAQGYLKAVGIDAEVEGVLMSAVTKYQTSGWNNAMVLETTYLGVGDDMAIDMKRPLAPNSYVSMLKPAEILTKLDQALAETDFAKKQQILKQVNKALVDDYCLIAPHSLPSTAVVKYPNVKDIKICEPINQLWTPENAWLSK
jgi:peptide/nickel transport system substrate-binding protein